MVRQEIKNLVILNRINEINFSNLNSDEKKWIKKYQTKKLREEDE